MDETDMVYTHNGIKKWHSPTRNHEVVGSIPGLTQWVKDPTMLWLRCGPAAVVLIRPLAWEHPYAMGVALKRPKQKNKTPTAIKGQNWDLNLHIQITNLMPHPLSFKHAHLELNEFP